MLKWFAISFSNGPFLSWTDIWVALHSMAHSFMELDKSVIHVISLVSFLWLVFILSALWWMRIRGLWKLPSGRDCGDGLVTQLCLTLCHSLSSGPRFVRTLHHDPLILGPLHGMAHRFLKLYKAVIHVISLISFLWLWFSFWRLWDYGSCFLMGETGCGENWFLLWWAGPCSVNL